MKKLFAGSNISLTSIKDNDIPKIENWFNNISFLRNYDVRPAIPKTHVQICNLIKSYMDSDERLIFAIRLNSGEIIGIIGYEDIIWTNNIATIFIGIGEDLYHSKGFGHEAMKLMIEYGFNELNFYRINLNVISYNQNAIKLYTTLGFVREGTLREFVSRDGIRYDLYLYGLLKNEWLEEK